ncbi:hypothetical protein GBB97_04525 [Bifidobacterium longum]|nr:hypothetical protein GBC16_04820 [Bifidobacterium longum]KAB7214449.1 hypothetical protein GBB97_04525 [Bifidobacterium longum]KAB7218874.1 hypothetical protein GBC26_05315 [Bifidobacterium longum]
MYDFLSPNKTNRDWKRGHEAMSQQILQVDQAMLETPDVYLEVQHPCWSCNSNSSSANASAGVR